MLYRFGSTRNPSDQYLRVYSEHAITRADCGALQRGPRRRFVAIAKETAFGSMIGLRRIRLDHRIRFAFSTCALFRFHSARCDALRWPLQARAASGNGPRSSADAVCRPALRRIKSYLCESGPLERVEQGIRMCRLVVLFNRRICDGRRSRQAGLSAKTSIAGSMRGHTVP
ncbi:MULTISPECIES: hypothetical protein [unclassified Burkholderia]|uniref:hypothetical protein n=1 Tax=unclassified Burkholderia TaxID=2613784 RepID=UPI001E63DF0F|nr:MULTISPECIES: hypothetical protein [unclassified Burkholderia]UEP29349.1 hypothetical protein LMA01_08050 [Burkholderia sp. B21-007]UEP42885.1 hypothetical protein LMA02_08030 [Burkholderia sp. B21-005]